MAKQKKPQVSPPAPFENTTEVEQGAVDTPDVQAFRAFAPDTTMLGAALDSQFENQRRNITDSYGAYSGIPSQVVRNRMRDEALNDLEGKKAIALAEGNQQAQALKMAQLQALAEMTARTQSRQKQSGYNTSVIQPQGSGLLGSAVSGAAGVGTAAIIA